MVRFGAFLAFMAIVSGNYLVPSHSRCSHTSEMEANEPRKSKSIHSRPDSSCRIPWISYRGLLVLRVQLPSAWTSQACYPVPCLGCRRHRDNIRHRVPSSGPLPQPGHSHRIHSRLKRSRQANSRGAPLLGTSLLAVVLVHGGQSLVLACFSLLLFSQFCSVSSFSFQMDTDQLVTATPDKSPGTKIRWCCRFRCRVSHHEPMGAQRCSTPGPNEYEYCQNYSTIHQASQPCFVLLVALQDRSLLQ